MWLQTTDGFFSVVEHRDNDELVLIRARTREDLENLTRYDAEGFDDEHIIEDLAADYQWRLIAPRAAWLEVLTKLTNEIDYDNFKDAVKKKQGPERASLYMSIWTVLRRLQYGNPEKGSKYGLLGQYSFDDEELEEGWTDDDVLADWLKGSGEQR